MKRVSSKIEPWKSRFKATILVDGYGVQKAYFFSEKEAKVWCKEQEALRREEVRER